MEPPFWGSRGLRQPLRPPPPPPAIQNVGCPAAVPLKTPAVRLGQNHISRRHHRYLSSPSSQANKTSLRAMLSLFRVLCLTTTGICSAS